MKAKGENQNKFVKIITLPIRALGKARDLYVRSMTGCTTGSGVRNRTSSTSVLPRSFSAVSSSSVGNDNEDYRDLIRAASVRSLGHKNELEYVLVQHRQQIIKESAAMMKGTASKSVNGTTTTANTGTTMTTAPSLMSKSCSVGMGRIDEDQAVEFDEDDSVVSGGNDYGKDKKIHKKNNMKSDLLFPRSKSYAVANRNVMI